MTAFFAALAAFFLLHMIPPMPAVRRRAVALLGLRGYLIVFSLVSIATLVWLVVAAARAPYVPLWSPASWQAYVPLVVMPFALWFAVAGIAERSPLSISIVPPHQDEPAGAMATVTRHPLLWALFLWAAAHIVPNGDLVSVIMFGGLAALAAGGFFILDARARRRLGAAAWSARTAATSIIPFASGTRHRWGRLALYAVIALIIYAAFLLGGHVLITGTDPLSWVEG